MKNESSYTKHPIRHSQMYKKFKDKKGNIQVVVFE